MMQFLRKQLLGEYLFWKVRLRILNFSFKLVEAMFLRVVNSFASFEQNHPCKYFFSFGLSFRLVIQKIPKWGFAKSFTRSSLWEVKEILSRSEEIADRALQCFSALVHQSGHWSLPLNTLPEFSGISIIRDPLFKIANKSLSAKLKQLKAQGFAKVQHHPSISPEDIQKRYETKVFSDDTPISVLRANWFNISLHFCRRGRENLRSLTPDSFVIKRRCKRWWICGEVYQWKTEKPPRRSRR